MSSIMKQHQMKDATPVVLTSLWPRLVHIKVAGIESLASVSIRSNMDTESAAGSSTTSFANNAEADAETASASLHGSSDAVSNESVDRQTAINIRATMWTVDEYGYTDKTVFYIGLPRINDNDQIRDTVCSILASFIASTYTVHSIYSDVVNVTSADPSCPQVLCAPSQKKQESHFKRKWQRFKWGVKQLCSCFR